MEIDVRRIAKLAMLEIPEEEVESFQKQFSAIVAMVDHLPEVEGEETPWEPAGRMQLREDVVVPSFPRDALLENAPRTAAGCIVVPRTVE